MALPDGSLIVAWLSLRSKGAATAAFGSHSVTMLALLPLLQLTSKSSGPSPGWNGKYLQATPRQLDFQGGLIDTNYGTACCPGVCSARRGLPVRRILRPGAQTWHRYVLPLPNAPTRFTSVALRHLLAGFPSAVPAANARASAARQRRAAPVPPQREPLGARHQQRLLERALRSRRQLRARKVPASTQAPPTSC